MIDYIPSKEYSERISLVERTDPVSADIKNNAIIQLANSAAYLHGLLQSIISTGKVSLPLVTEGEDNLVTEGGDTLIATKKIGGN